MLGRFCQFCPFLIRMQEAPIRPPIQPPIHPLQEVFLDDWKLFTGTSAFPNFPFLRKWCLPKEIVIISHVREEVFRVSIEGWGLGYLKELTYVNHETLFCKLKVCKLKFSGYNGPIFLFYLDNKTHYITNVSQLVFDFKLIDKLLSTTIRFPSSEELKYFDGNDLWDFSVLVPECPEGMGEHLWPGIITWKWTKEWKIIKLN